MLVSLSNVLENCRQPKKMILDASQEDESREETNEHTV